MVTKYVERTGTPDRLGIPVSMKDLQLCNMIALMPIKFGCATYMTMHDCIYIHGRTEYYQGYLFMHAQP